MPNYDHETELEDEQSPSISAEIFRLQREAAKAIIDIESKLNAVLGGGDSGAGSVGGATTASASPSTFPIILASAHETLNRLRKIRSRVETL